MNQTIEIHDAPPVYDADLWEDSAEGDMEYDDPDGAAVWHWSLDQALPENRSLKLTAGGRHRYRVRIYARGRAIEHDGPVLKNPVENYLIQMWPTSAPQPARQTKHLSGV
ncbi:hypothetical protein DK926_02210 [Rhodococcus sp. Eu-32]|uniref:hypothetical protein n=1 Tax=Rhodococcus sp. Eu-32 TaxID=1017319 RepID=UPI000DF42F47|nr:hypothetical protein [Rhodococcus sp. Eu-32]RRQ29700.1 hypothetical protein DK926_02210 [Rhodococcus sp. Eu-32]